jgi:hypothetical protein
MVLAGAALIFYDTADWREAAVYAASLIVKREKCP